MYSTYLFIYFWADSSMNITCIPVQGFLNALDRTAVFSVSDVKMCCQPPRGNPFHKSRADSPALGWVWVDNMALEALRGSQGNNWGWSDQSATQDDLRTPAGRNPITAATDSDRWVRRSAPPQHKSQGIEVTGEKSPSERFTAHVRFCFLRLASTKTLPHLPKAFSLLVLFLM